MDFPRAVQLAPHAAGFPHAVPRVLHVMEEFVKDMGM